MATKTDLLKLIRQNCSECMGGPRVSQDIWPIKNPGDVAHCTATECGFSKYRFGKDPDVSELRRVVGRKSMQAYWRRRKAVVN
jgi:hypothetical protein